MTQGVTSWEKHVGLSLGALAHPESALTDKRPHPPFLFFGSTTLLAGS